jgi:two-component system, NarL family, response regulator YdfI
VIRVLIVASSIVMQAGLAALLSDSPALTVVGAATALMPDHLTTLQPDVVLLEWDSPEEEGAIALSLGEDRLPDALSGLLPGVLSGMSLEVSPGTLPEAEPQIGFVVLVEAVSSAWLSEILHSSIRGVLPQTAAAAEIIAAIEAVAAGLTVLHPDLMELLLSRLAIAPRPIPTAQPLTPREVEVLEMLAEGLGNKAIAKRLNISEHTVKFHVGSIFSKLNASSRTEAVAIGARQGLILL